MQPGDSPTDGGTQYSPGRRTADARQAIQPDGDSLRAAKTARQRDSGTAYIYSPGDSVQS